MPVKKNRTQSKCRDWERERRSRLCAAFTQLAALLPSTPPTSTKILILQHSIKYIQELQQIHAPLKRFDNALSVQESNEGSLRKELSLLQERCSQLIGQLQRAGLSADENVSPIVNKTCTNVAPTIDSEIKQDDVNKSNLNERDHQKVVSDNNSIDSEKKADDNPDVLINTSNGESTRQKAKKNIKKQNSKIKKKIKRNVHITKKKITKRKLQATVGQTSCLIVSGDTISGVARPISLALKNNQNNNVWVTSNNLGVVSNGLLPLLPLNAPLLIPPAPQQQTIYLLQRPITKDSGLLNLNVAEGSKQPTAFSVNSVPLLNSSAVVGNQQKRVHKVYSNFYGFDITKTTMVNKVPIPAFSSTLSMNRGRTADKHMKPMRVTQRSRSKLLNSLNASKKAQALSNSFRKNKENVQKTESIKPKDTNPVTNESADPADTKPILKDSASDVKSTQLSNNIKPIEKISEIKSTNSPVTTVHNVNNIEKCNVILRRNDKIIENSSKPKDTKENSTSEPPAIVNKTSDGSFNCYEMIKKCEPETLNDANLFPSNNGASHCLLNSESVKAHQFPKESTIHKISHSTDGENLFTKSRNMPIDKMDNHISTILDISKNTASNKSDFKKRKCENDAVHGAINPFMTGRSINSSDCRIESSKVGQLDERSLGPAEIAEDLLASFGGGPEQAELPPSPLASSPMAASPTAAFLLAFPLVCPGPRPDTPLNDNLQTPNICSLDNFSTFFTHKESMNGANNIFPDYLPKIPNVQISGDKSKTNWPFGDQNKQNYNNLMPYSEVFDSNKYPKTVDNFKLTDKNYHNKPPATTSSACAYSNTQTLFTNSKSINTNSFYSLPESIFTYEHTPVMNNAKIDSKNGSSNNNFKNQFYFENIASQSTLKNKLLPANDNSLFTSMATSYMESMPSSNSTGNLNKINTYAPPAINESNNCRKHQGGENSMKIVLPGVIPEYSSASKSIDAPFTFASQVKSSIYPGSSNIYTSCNTYNPFSSDFPVNSTNIGLACGNTVDSVRSKPSAACFLDFNAPNVYPQNMNSWSDDNANGIQNKKPDAPMIINQNSHISTELQPDFRFTLPLISKCANNKTSNIPIDVKNIKNGSNKVNNRDIKYNTSIDSKNIKPEFSVQKGPVNWMTSEVVSAQNGNEMFMVTPPCADFTSSMPGISSSLTCKKGDMYDQPFYHMPPGSYAPQVIGEDNQFTWSPSKLPPLGDGVSLAPCSLPTLVGDLALGIGADPKLSYPGTLVEHDPVIKDRKNMSVKSKEGYVKNNSNQNIDLNNSNTTGNFLSVSQLMERGKAGSNLTDNITQCKSNPQYNQKKSSVLDHSRQYNVHSSTVNKVFDANNSLPLFPLDVIPNQQLNQLNLPVQQKDNNFNVKPETTSKSINKNNYSTEALLQNNHTQYQSNRKQRHSSTIQKAYHDVSNASVSTGLTGNQHIPLQFDNYAQTQQYTGNVFPYGSQAASGMNSSFYSSSNFIAAPATMVTSNYMNAGFTPDMTDFSNNTNENIFYVPKLESCKPKTQNEQPPEIPKYSFNNKSFNQPKEPPVKHRQDPSFKKETSSNAKRPKKHKNSFVETYSHYGAISNTVNSPIGMDDSFFGYFSSSQMHPYPSQPPALPAIQPVGQSNQKIVSATGKPIMAANSAMSASPNPTGTSLTNFNLSTIFPEINKRTTMPGFHDAQQTISKPPCPILFQ